MQPIYKTIIHENLYRYELPKILNLNVKNN